MATTYSTPFMQKPDAGFRLGDIRAIFDAIVNENAISAAYGISAAGTTQATGTQLSSVINAVDTVTASTGVNLPSSTGLRTVPFRMCYVINNGASTLAVYAAQSTSDTINGIAGATGITMASGTNALFLSAQGSKWESIASAGVNADFGALTATSLTVASTTTLTNVTLGSIIDSGNLTFTTAASGTIYKQGSNGRTGTVTLAGTAPVTVSNTIVATTDVICISLNTVGGTVSVTLPSIRTITAATGFTIAGLVGDVSTYNYAIFKSAI